MSQVQKGFGRRVRYVREAMGLPQSRFAQSVLSPGASAVNIGRIEREEVLPRASTIQKIAGAGAELKWLTGGLQAYKANEVVHAAGFGERLRKLRETRGYTSRTLASLSELGASSKNVSRLESGEVSPRRRTVERLARALQVSPEALA